MESIQEKVVRGRTRKRRIGLIVNPIAGMGGPVGLKGTDGFETYLEALRKGARPRAGSKMKEAFEAIKTIAEDVDIVTCEGDMGLNIIRQIGIEPIEIVDVGDDGMSEPSDTMQAVIQMNQLHIDLIVFAGGDGTARNISAVNFKNTICVGVPAGVKIQSSCFARTPREAGELICDFIKGKITRIREAEVVDLDEKLYRQGIVAPKFYNTLIVPDSSGRMQNKKFRTPSSEYSDQLDIASEIVRNMENELYIIGPGSTTQAILNKLKLPSTLIGIDAVQNGQLIGQDLTEQTLLELIENRKNIKLLLTPVGGQGFLLGRGNQQLSPKVLKRIGKENIIVVATKHKLQGLDPQTMWIDTGNQELNEKLRGYIRVVTGIKEVQMFKIG